MQIFGHRGSPGFPRYGENTLHSFQRALDQGADGIELDVRRTADGRIVVIHDATIDRTTNGAGRVASLTYEQIRRFDAGHGEPVPRLIDVLETFGNRTLIHIELKESPMAQEVTNLVVGQNLTSSVVLSAFDTDDSSEAGASSWHDLSVVASQVSIALLAARGKFERLGPGGLVAAAQAMRATAIHAHRDIVTPEFVRLSRNAGLDVRVWTVNAIETIPQWRALGIDAIFSDFPGKCVQVLHHASL